jgi:hypothetical protein
MAPEQLLCKTCDFRVDATPRNARKRPVPATASERLTGFPHAHENFTKNNPHA